jgi:hypothetical protein
MLCKLKDVLLYPSIPAPTLLTRSSDLPPQYRDFRPVHRHILPHMKQRLESILKYRPERVLSRRLYRALRHRPKSTFRARGRAASRFACFARARRRELVMVFHNCDIRLGDYAPVSGCQFVGFDACWSSSHSCGAQDDHEVDNDGILHCDGRVRWYDRGESMSERSDMYGTKVEGDWKAFGYPCQSLLVSLMEFRC